MKNAKPASRRGRCSAVISLRIWDGETWPIYRRNGVRFVPVTRTRKNGMHKFFFRPPNASLQENPEAQRKDA